MLAIGHSPQQRAVGVYRMKRTLPLLLAVIHAAGGQQYNVNANPYSQHTQQRGPNQQQSNQQAFQQGGLQHNNPFNRPLTNGNGQMVPQGPGPVVIQHPSNGMPTPYHQQGNGMAGSATTMVSGRR